MKKLILFLILILMVSIPALANAVNECCVELQSINNKLVLSKQPPIEDELVKSDCFPKLRPIYVMDKEPIVDELVEQYNQDSTGAIKLFARKRGEYKNVSIEDELINTKFKDRFGTISILKKQTKQAIEDNFVKNNIDFNKLTAIKVKNKYDFTKAQIPVKLKIIKNLTTKNNVLEGDQILFKTVDDLTVNGLNLPKGTKIVGRVETVSESDKMGTPANIIVDNFHVKNNPDICFYGNISKSGANRAIWVYPLYQAGNLVLYVAGFVFVPIHGGHAKLLTNETYTVFYETH